MPRGEWAVSDAYKPKPGGSQQHQQPRQAKGARNTTVGGGLPSTKKQARSLERLLRRNASSSGGTLPADVVKEKQEAVKLLTEKAASNKRIERERHFSKKYHKVKFFERLKCEKRIGVLRKQLAEASVATKKAALEEQLREAEHDLLYVQHFPRHKKYLSLFPSEENPYVTKERARMGHETVDMRVYCHEALHLKDKLQKAPWRTGDDGGKMRGSLTSRPSSST